MKKTIIVKASLKAMRLWLSKISNDESQTENDRWLARQVLDYINLINE